MSGIHDRSEDDGRQAVSATFAGGQFSLPINRVPAYAFPMRCLLATLILIILPLPALAADYPARVVGVTDGDTLTVLRGGRDRAKIKT